MTKRTMLFTAVFAGAAIGSTMAVAQDNTNISPASGTANPIGKGGAPNQIEQVVVTAQRRSEKIVKVPIAIVAVSGTTLKKSQISQVGDLQQVVAGFTEGYTGVHTQPTIRGVGTQDAGPGESANVATYVDGFYQPNELASNVQFSDIASVEVLKGPQGTLYGRNATGGAVLINTRQPSFTPTADINASYGNLNSGAVGMFATGPIFSDVLAGSIALNSDNSDGYTRNIVTNKTEGGRDNSTIRIKLLYRPTDDISFLLGFTHINYLDSDGYQYSVYQGHSDAALIPGAIITDQPHETSSKYPPYFNSHTNDVNLKSKFALDFATLTSYTSVDYEHDASAFEFDNSSLALETVAFPTKDRTAQQEFDLSSNGNGRLTWTTGLFLLYDKGNTEVSLQHPFLPLQFAQEVTKSAAVFGEATYRILPKLYLTAGARYSLDRLTETYASAIEGVPQTSHSTSFNAVTPRVVLRYDFTNTQSGYLSFNEGYKSGTFNAQGFSPVPVQPERIKAYEAGYKISEGNLAFNTAAFYYDYSNLQVTSISPLAGASTILTNAARARIYGAEADLNYELFGGLRVTGGFAYVHSRFVSFPGGPEYVWSPLSGVSILKGDASGNPIPNSPDFSGQVGLDYVLELNRGTFEANGNFALRSVTYFDAFKQTSQPGYGTLNMRLSWEPPSKRWGLHLFMKNALDKTYLTAVQPLPISFLSAYAPPRTYGIELTVHL